MPTMSLRDEVEGEARREVGRRALEEKNVPMRVEGGLGGSPVSPLEQVRTAASTLVQEVLPDGDGALRLVFEQDLRADEKLLGALTGGVEVWTPEELRPRLMAALAQFAARVLATDAALEEFTRRVDAAWGRLMGERPLFQAPGGPAQPDDPYTHESVRAALQGVVTLARRA